MKKTTEKEYLKKVIDKGSYAAMHLSIRQLKEESTEKTEHELSAARDYLEFLTVKAMTDPEEIDPKELRESFEEIKQEPGNVKPMRDMLDGLCKMLEIRERITEASEGEPAWPELEEEFEEFYNRIDIEKIREVREELGERIEELAEKKRKEAENDMYA